MQEPLSVPTRSAAFPGFLQAVALLLLTWAGIIAVAAGFLVVRFLMRGTLETTAPAALLVVSNTVGFALALVVGWKWSGASARRLFPFRAFDARILLPLVLVSAGAVVLMSQTEVWLRLLPLSKGIRDVMTHLDEATVKMVREAFGMSLLAVGLVAPLTEELFFRGMLLHGFLARYGRRAAIPATAAFFAVAHLAPTQIVPAFLVGLFLAWLVAETQNLWLSLFTHGAFNVLGVLAMRLFSAGATPEEAAAEGVPLWLLIAATVATVVGIAWVRQLLRQKETTRDVLPA